MANILFISVNDINAHGSRMLSAAVKKAGHESSLLFFKRPGYPYSFYHKKYWNEAKKIKTLDWIGIDHNGRPYQYSRGPVITSNEKKLLISLITDIQPDAIGISVTAPLINRIAEITKIIKGSIDLPVIWGGAGATIDPETCLKFCDFVCVGEGEKTIAKIADCIENNTGFHDVENLCYMDGDVIIKNRLSALIDNLDELPFPDISPHGKYLIEDDTLVNNFSEISYSGRYHVMGSRGCLFNCSYCTESYYKKLYQSEKFLRRRSPLSIINELKSAKEIFEFQIVQFEDEIFSLDYEWLKEYKELYTKEINLPFSCYVYPKKNLDRQLRLLKDAGMFDTCLSLQSGSEKINREFFHRPFKKENYYAVARQLEALGLVYYTDIITYCPFETEDDLKETLEVLMEVPAKPKTIYINKLYVLKNTDVETIIHKEDSTRKAVRLPDRLFDYYVRLFQFTVSENKQFIDFCRQSKIFRWFPFILRSRMLMSKIKSFTGINPLNEQELKKWMLVLENKRAWFALHNVRYCLAVKAGKYPLFKKRIFSLLSRAGDKARAEQLIEYLQNNSGIKISDLRGYNGSEERHRHEADNLYQPILEDALAGKYEKYILLEEEFKTGQVVDMLQETEADLVIETIYEDDVIDIPSYDTDTVNDLFNSSDETLLRIDASNGYVGVEALNQVQTINDNRGLLIKADGSDPQCILPEVVFPEDVPVIVKVELTAPGSTYLQIFFCTSEMPYHAEVQSVRAPLKKGKNRCCLQLVPHNFIGQLRIDPGTIKGDYLLSKLEIRTQTV